MNELLAVIEGQIIGRLTVGGGGRVTFAYDGKWLATDGAHSLSTSLKLAKIVYPQRVVVPYLWNLLPENPNVLQRWGQQYHVSAANPFKLLAYVGADVPGGRNSFRGNAWRRFNPISRQSTGLRTMSSLSGSGSCAQTSQQFDVRATSAR